MRLMSTAKHPSKHNEAMNGRTTDRDVNQTTKVSLPSVPGASLLQGVQGAYAKRTYVMYAQNETIRKHRTECFCSDHCSCLIRT
jgi:hypothetical protein